MSLEHWLAFVAASAFLLAIPGPTILLVVSYALGHGRKAAASTVDGVALGDFTAMTASMLGLGALLAVSATLFTALKWIGAAYLVCLGVRLWRAPVAAGAADRAAAVNAALCALLASAARNSIRKPGVQRAVNRIGGSLMIGAGALAAGWRRAAA